MLNRSFVLIIFVGLAFFSFQSYSQIRNDAEEAFRISTESNKPLLLVFAGSDWCATCIRFEKKILSEAHFLDFAKENLVILKADFPQRTPLTEALKEQNASLAEKYNPDGVFPYLVLLRSESSILSSLYYSNQSPAEFIAEIKSYISK